MLSDQPQRPLADFFGYFLVRKQESDTYQYRVIPTNKKNHSVTGWFYICIPAFAGNAKTAAAHTAVPATKIERGEMKKIGSKFILTVRFVSDWKRFHFNAGCPAGFLSYGIIISINC